MGDRSGLPDGQVITGISFAANQSFVLFAVWQEAPSCWNMYSPYSQDRCGIEGTRCSDKIFWYLSAFIVPCTTWREPTPCADIHPHTITEAANLTFLLIANDSSDSHGFRITLGLVSPNETSKRDSSLHITLAHSRSVHLACSLTQATRLSFCTAVSNGLSFGYDNSKK